jgi:hypothetical protein
MFRFFFLYLRLVAPFFSFPLVSFAIGPRLSPLLSTSRPLSRLDITFIHCVYSEYRTLFAYDAVRSVAGRTVPFDSALPFPHFSPLCVAYAVSLRTRTQSYKHPSPGFDAAQFSPFRFACVSGQPWPILVSSSLVSFVFPRLSRRPIRFQPPPLATAVCESVCSASSSQLTPTFRPSRRVSASSYICGSGDNNPRAPPLVAPACVLLSGTSLGFYFFCALIELTRGLSLRLSGYIL